jgi:hypothetical protein
MAQIEASWNKVDAYWNNVDVDNQFNATVFVGLFKVKEDVICIRNCVQKMLALVSEIVEVPPKHPTHLKFKHSIEGPGTTFRLYIARSAAPLLGLMNETDSNVLNSWNVRVRGGGAIVVGSGTLPDDILDNRLAHKPLPSSTGGSFLDEKAMSMFRVKNGGSITKWVQISISGKKMGGGGCAHSFASSVQTTRKFITPPVAIHPNHVQEFHVPHSAGTELFLSWVS